MEAPGALEETRFPSVIVPVCVVKGVSAPPCVSGVMASVPGCVLPSTPCVSEGVCVTETPCMNETPRVSGMVCVKETARVRERPNVRKTACVRSLCVREMSVGMHEHAAASPGVSVMEWSVSVVTRRCAWLEWGRRPRQTMD